MIGPVQKFFIDVIDGEARHDDDVGEEATFDQVKADAVLTLLDLFRQDLASLDERRALAVVRDVRGEVLYTASLTFKGESRV